MTNQQAPEIYALHTVPNEGKKPWFGIYAVRDDAEHDAKVMRDATGRDWSVVRLVVADAAATPTGPITRYEVVDCIDSKHVPAVIPNGAGPWVRYEDHVAALAEAQQPAPSAAAALPEGWVPLVITHEGQYPEEVAYGPKVLMDRLGKWLRKYFDHVVASKAQPSPTPRADSQPAPEYVGNGMFKGETIEKAAEHWANWCDVRCMTGLSEFLRVVAARAPADSVLEDAARLDWLALAGPVSICLVIDRPHDGEIEVATDDVIGYGKTLREALDAARKQGGV